MNTAIIRKMEQLYKRISRPVENIVFPLILLLWPLVKVNQGVDVSDTTYSLGNYVYTEGIQMMWKLSTYLSNAVGSLVVRLPYGDRLLGANIYCGLLVSATALICYYCLRRDFTAPVLFLGEILAINCYFIPATILYNTLTYMLFTVGAIFIYKALTSDKDRYLMLAGLALGLNLFIRVSNLLEAGLIVVVWVVTCHEIREKTWNKILIRTGYCLLGYIIGAGVPALVILGQYGIDGIGEMIAGLSSVTTTDSTYTPLRMITGTIAAYIHSLRWMGIILLGIGMGTAMFAIAQDKVKWLKRILYTLGIVVMLRFFWGRGMYTFRFYEDYTAMYEWGMILLYLSIAAELTVIIRAKKYNVLVYTYAWIALMIQLITPLGSNNTTYQSLNNLYLILPFTVYVVGGWMYRGIHRLRLEGILHGCNYPWMSMTLVLVAFITLETSLFHLNFVFRDGMRGEGRETEVTGVSTLAGMYTNEVNATSLQELEALTTDLEADYAVYYGDCPGLSYILRLPSAISSSWPSLDSYAPETLSSELERIDDELEGKKIIYIIKAIEDPSELQLEKDKILREYISSKSLDCVYKSEQYLVYM